MESFGLSDKHQSINKRKLDYYELTEEDFYPPQDNRYYCSGVMDIRDGDNFADYSKWFYENYEEELFDV